MNAAHRLTTFSALLALMSCATTQADESAAQADESVAQAPAAIVSDSQPGPTVGGRGFQLAIPAGLQLVTAAELGEAKTNQFALRNRLQLSPTGQASSPDRLNLDVGHRPTGVPPMDAAQCQGVKSMLEQRAPPGSKLAVTILGLSKLGGHDVCQVQVSGEGRHELMFLGSDGPMALTGHCASKTENPEFQALCRQAFAAVELRPADRAYGTGYSIPIPAGFAAAGGKALSQLGSTGQQVQHSAIVFATEHRGANKMLGSIVVIAAPDDGNDVGDEAICAIVAKQLVEVTGRTDLKPSLWSAERGAETLRGCRLDSVAGGDRLRFHFVRAFGIPFAITCTLATNDEAGLAGCDAVAEDVRQVDASPWWQTEG